MSKYIFINIYTGGVEKVVPLLKIGTDTGDTYLWSRFAELLQAVAYRAFRVVPTEEFRVFRVLFGKRR